ARDAIYDKTPASLDAVHSRTDVAIRIFSREGDELYNSQRDPEPPGRVLTEARNSRLQEPAVTQDLRERSARLAEWNRVLPEHAKNIPGMDRATQG
ncbi:hypothetical protein, partial [Pseudomonas viridiflava]|uniref:hypothetical protein n=1 Tax=Pseudomonas viridiflava TaxID=33069 RepID=UPI001981B917